MLRHQAHDGIHRVKTHRCTKKVVFIVIIRTKRMIVDACFPQSPVATAHRLQNFALVEPRTAHHVSHQTSTFNQISAINKKQCTKQGKQNKTRL
jgi:hypothetical protein